MYGHVLCNRKTFSAAAQLCHLLIIAAIVGSASHNRVAFRASTKLLYLFINRGVRAAFFGRVPLGAAHSHRGLRTPYVKTVSNISVHAIITDLYDGATTLAHEYRRPILMKTAPTTTKLPRWENLISH